MTQNYAVNASGQMSGFSASIPSVTVNGCFGSFPSARRVSSDAMSLNAGRIHQLRNYPMTRVSSDEDNKHHTLLEDVQGLLVGTATCAFGLAILQHLGLVTGQTAGLALILAYWGDWSFGLVFFVVNLPFYWLALRRIGMQFVIKTFISIALLSLFTTLFASQITFAYVNALVGTILFGVFTGTGLLVIFRHGASLGGAGILALYLQDKTGFQAGWTQLIFDVIVFCLAFLVIDANGVALSLMGAVFVNLAIAVNHRRDRYVGY